MTFDEWLGYVDTNSSVAILAARDAWSYQQQSIDELKCAYEIQYSKLIQCEHELSAALECMVSVNKWIECSSYNNTEIDNFLYGLRGDK